MLKMKISHSEVDYRHYTVYHSRKGKLKVVSLLNAERKQKAVSKCLKY